MIEITKKIIMELDNINLEGRYDNHIHCCPHINSRSLNLYDAVKDAEREKMVAIGLMDNFSVTSGYASLMNSIFKNFKIKVFGGLIMEPYAGGINPENLKTLMKYSYGDFDQVFKFVSFPTHHTQFIAKQEKRNDDYINNCFSLNDIKKANKDVLKILDIIAINKLVLNTGHLSDEESINLINLAKKHGVKKILVPANHLTKETINEINSTIKVFFEFSYFFISKAANIPLTHIDGEKHIIHGLEKNKLSTLIKSAKTENIILSSDCGVSVLPRPVDGLKIFISEILKLGFTIKDIDNMTKKNPQKLFYC